ncbi:SDR family oxidoreductase [Solimonas sp. K1W22B-7]|uniref:SDR family NAD(P)-dependent oxidoreductase n=1 Tax=Solimonas sp. K1W22B-7 TaxID=2303331 RepID=UPI000E336DB8|nr:SDR family oxidoreductase [Solimonas sp. K1W22B-7]AXQ31438.1 SDR family oxidoreductase [Solimonas sp. K1W22B-7]
MKQLMGKVAVITGAGSGIGRACALELGRAGCRLALSDVSQAGLAGTVAACEALGIEARGYALDVSKREAVYAHAEDVKRDFGNANLVLNNAGVSVAARADETSWADFEWLMGINFWGVTYGTQAFLPQLIASGDGHVVNVSSVFGLIGAPGNAAYNAAKFGVRGYTEALRLEMTMEGHPVQVSCVHPGGIRTNIARTARKGESVKDRDLGSEFEKLARTTPEQAAAIIVRGIRANRPRILVGGDAVVIEWLARLLGIGYQPLIARFMKDKIKDKAN